MGWTFTDTAGRGFTPRQLVAELVRLHGYEFLLDASQEAQGEVKRQEESYDLPEGFRFFEQHDWMGFAGAERFADGVRPVIGVIDLDQPRGDDERVVVKDYPVVLSGSSGKKGKCLAGVSGVMESEDEDEDGSEFGREFGNLREAVEFFRLIRESGKPLSFERFLALGFDRLN